MTKNNYEVRICRLWKNAKHIPFRSVSLNGWVPKENKCHDNVDVWIKENRGHAPARGWINYYPIFQGVRLVSHSVVRDEDGNLFDITPFSDEKLRIITRFVLHSGDEERFISLRNKYIDCKTTDVATMG